MNDRTDIDDDGLFSSATLGEDGDEIPIFPLGTVLFPGGFLPLRIFEPRYLDMVSDCMRNERPFGVCLIREGKEVGEPAEPHPVGTLANIVDWGQDDKGALTIDVIGWMKFRLLETRVAPDQLLLGRCEPMLEPAVSSIGGYEPVAHLTRTLMERMKDRHGIAPPPPDASEWQDAAWLGYRLAELIPMPMNRRYHLLEIEDPELRLQELQGIISQVAEASRSRKESDT